MTLLFITFILLLAIGLPIALAMIGSSLLVIGLDGTPLSVVAQRVVTGVQSFPLLAIPLFTLAGVADERLGHQRTAFWIHARICRPYPRRPGTDRHRG